MVTPGEEARLLPGEYILLTEPDDVYVAALAAMPVKADIKPDDFAMVRTAVFDLALPPGDPRIPELPSKRELAQRLAHRPTLAEIQLAATQLDGPRTPAGRAAESLGRTAVKLLPALEVVKSPAHQELFNAARRFIRQEYGTEWNGDYPAPFLWGAVIRRLGRDGAWFILPESWNQLAARYIASYDRGLRDRRHAISMPPDLYWFRLNLYRHGVQAAIERFVFSRWR